MILKQRQTRKSRRPAFTLMEMLVVVAIIVALAGIGGYFFMGALSESKVSSAKIQAKVITQALEAYSLKHGTYPNTLRDLLVPDEFGSPPYLKSADAIIDPWGREYQYDPSGQKNMAAGAVVVIPDVFAVAPDNRIVGNWSEGKR